MFKETCTAKLSPPELAKLNELKVIYGYPEMYTATFREILNMMVNDLLQIKAAQGDPHKFFRKGIEVTAEPAPAENAETAETAETAEMPAAEIPAPEPAPQGLFIPFTSVDLFYIDAMKAPYQRRTKIEVTPADFVQGMIKGLYKYGRIHSEVLFTQKEIRDRERAAAV